MGRVIRERPANTHKKFLSAHFQKSFRRSDRKKYINSKYIRNKHRQKKSFAIESIRKRRKESKTGNFEKEKTRVGSFE
jgi:hypothetical protein